jgi:hypothetical protein
MASFLTNPILWIGSTIFFALMFILMVIFFVFLAKKTHMIVELKGMMKGRPICMFFQENRYVEWIPLQSEAGIIKDDNYGAFIINEKATYIDKRTKNVIIPFDAQFGASINMHAAKLVDDLQYTVADEEEMKKLRYAIANNMIDDNDTISGLKTSIHIGAIKTMMTALIPHNINSKIEKIIAARLKNYGAINVPQIALLFAAILGAILLGALIIKLTFGAKQPT